MNSADNALVSLPMLAKMIGLRSVRDLRYERLLIRMREDATLDDADKVVRDILRAMDPIVAEQVNVKKDKAALYANVDQTMSYLFTALILITMFLCFFQLSTSMSANLFEQSKEIGVLLSLGFTRSRII